MEKRGLLLSFILGLFSINLISAQFYGGGYSLSDILYLINPSTVFLGIIFVISFTLINIGLSRVFRDNKAVPAVLSLALSFGIIYGMNRMNFNYDSIFYSFFFFVPPNILETLIPIISLILLLIIIWKFKGNSLIVLGLFLLVLSFFVYESALIMGLGIGLIVTWVVLKFLFSKKKDPVDNISSGSGESRGSILGKKAWSGTKSAGRKAADVGREWTKRDKAMRDKMAAEAERRKAQGKQAEQKAQQQTQQKSQAKQANQQDQAKQIAQQQKVQQKQIGMDFRALKAQIIETQRKNPRDPRLEGWIKTLKKLRKQK